MHALLAREHLVKFCWVRKLIFICFSLGASNVYAENSDVTLNIVGLENNQGEVLVSLFQNEDGYPSNFNKALRRMHVKPNDKKASIVISNLDATTDYAIAVCHDANNNNECDTNFLGIPKEGVAVSNNAKAFMGPPSFEDAKFKPKNTAQLTVKIQY